MIFYLPIYNRTRSEFEHWLELEISKSVCSSMPYRLQIAITDRLEKEYGSTWEQNHAVGWIKIEKGQGGFSFILAKSTTFVKSKKSPRYMVL